MRPQFAPRWVAVADLAGRQHGVVARWQLLELGFSSRGVSRALADGRLHAVYRGVYAVGHRLLYAGGRKMAAVLACGCDAVLSHWSAADLWEILPTARAAVDVTVVRSRRSRAGIRIHSVRELHDHDRTIKDGVPVTSVARTLLDLADVAPRRQLENAIEGAERRGLFDLRAVNELCGRTPGRRGPGTLRAVLADYREAPHTRRDLERLFIDVCRNGDLPEPACNVTVEGYEVDATWPGTKIVVELDSWEFHGTRGAFERDRVRDEKLAVAGHRVIRITWRRLTREPDQVVATLRNLLRVT